jgi:CspA family cold shock protein
VAWYDPRKGYGFIHGDAGHDVFVHRTSIQGHWGRTLRSGESVEYQVEQTERGPAARDVRALSE